ncbi:MAG: hypothetical protein WCA21_21015 [Terracidiphilus sp.]
MNDSARLGLTTKELPNELEFCFAREQSGTMQIVAIVLALVSAIAAFIPASLRPEAFWIFATVSAAFLGWALWMAADTARNWKRVYKTTLTATAQRIEATAVIVAITRRFPEIGSQLQQER